MMVAVCDAENAEVERQKINAPHAITGSHWRSATSGGLAGIVGTAAVTMSPKLFFSRETGSSQKQDELFHEARKRVRLSSDRIAIPDKDRAQPANP